MNEDFVSFDLAKKLKKNGFPQYTEKSYFVGDHEKRMCSVGTFLRVHTQNTAHLISAPTISQVLKWLREEKKRFVVIHPEGHDVHYYYTVHNLARSFDDVFEYTQSFATYEEAALEGIEYVIDNLI